MSYAITSLRRLEKQQERESAHVADSQWYEFLAAPSCPPDKRIHIRGGVANPSGQWGWIMQNDFISDVVCDFENETDTQLTLNFTNADYYLGLILCYYGEYVSTHTLGPPYDTPVFDNVIGTEVETAAEAETQIDAFLNGNTQWYNYRMPLWGMVLRNDGQVGINYAILPIDAVNRGRSYLYRDARSDGGIIP